MQAGASGRAPTRGGGGGARRGGAVAGFLTGSTTIRAVRRRPRALAKRIRGREHDAHDCFDIRGVAFAAGELAREMARPRAVSMTTSRQLP